jgi:uncharacterized protein
MTVRVGEVVAVKGVSITIKMFEDSNKDVLFFSGDKYKGVSIREHLVIQRGFVDIVCVVEGEYLDENRSEQQGNKIVYTRKIEVKPIGYFKSNKFYDGVKYLPMIKDVASLMPEESIAGIYNQRGDSEFLLGKMLKEELPIFVPWKKLFNTHIGIFGNTGSGKSNTLTKLYTVLFDSKSEKLMNKSHFALLDFNGEYTKSQFFGEDKKDIIKLNTRSAEDKFPLNPEEFWNTETLSILFQATTNTQRPFLNRLIGGRKRFESIPDSLLNYTKSIFKKVFTSSAPKPECLDLLRAIAKLTGNNNLLDALKEIQWFNNIKFAIPGSRIYFEADGASYTDKLEAEVNNITLNLNCFEELVLRANIQLSYDLLYGYVQFDHIQPLLKRVESSFVSLQNVLSVDTQVESEKILTVISFRKCSSEIKKVLALLIAKHYYNSHKESINSPPDKTMHIIIDEAHNILSGQSSRESESWKDYRLELFEEIIKEGRKFGVFLTISSQRPADISPTIVSQVHNFFIHRLINDRDLFLIDNTISTLDKLSRELIPTLPQGACIATGTSFPLPMVIHVDLLDREKQPDSEDVNLEKLWS